MKFFPVRKVSKLEQLVISEVSAVDDPASMLPGWLVVKNRGGDIFEQIHRAAADHVEENGGNEDALRREMIVTAAADLPEVRTARHSARHESTGRFVPAEEPAPAEEEPTQAPAALLFRAAPGSAALPAHLH